MSDFRFRDRFRDETWTESLGVSVPRRENRESLHYTMGYELKNNSWFEWDEKNGMVNSSAVKLAHKKMSASEECETWGPRWLSLAKNRVVESFSPHASPFRLEIRTKTLISQPSLRFSLQTFEIRLCCKHFITTNLTYLLPKLKKCQITWHPDRFKSLQSWLVDLL